MRRTRSNTLREFGVPALAALAFLAIESYGSLPELALTAFIICVTLLLFAVQDHPHEPALFVVGVCVGLFVEVGLRQLGYQQRWSQGSLLGVPYWLPVAWGIGFVLITRLGIRIRRLRVRR